MRIFSSPSLAAAVSRAGGIGFIGPGAKQSDLESQLSEAKTLLNHPDKSILPIGVGIQTFAGDLDVASTAVGKWCPAAVWLFAPRNGQVEFDIWTRRMREVSNQTKIWIQVGSVRDAIAAATSSMPPDVLVLQGHDAGGHGLKRGSGIISLLPEVADALEERGLDIPLVAAGGIADGRGVAASLSVGAVGAALGTRFLASQEANISKGYLGDVLRTNDGGQNTMRTTLYDELAGRTDWPEDFDGRNVVNRSLVDYVAGVEFEQNKKRYEDAVKRGDDAWGEKGRATAYVGTGVGLVRQVEKAEDIVTKAREAARIALQRARSLL
jgi:nitronate monooxygenase